MLVNILDKNYIFSDTFIKDFRNNTIGTLDEHYSGESIEIPELNPFLFYLKINDETKRNKAFQKSISILFDYVEIADKYTMSHEFWISLFSINFYDFTVSKYPGILEDDEKFRNVLLKQFDWNNYIYKLVLAAKYIHDKVDQYDKKKYIDLISNNLDVYNYLLKYPIFRNGKFIVNVLKIIDENDLSADLKKSLKRKKSDLDQRFGRKILFELNKDYPVIVVPMLEYDKLEKRFMSYYSYYKREFGI